MSKPSPFAWISQYFGGFFFAYGVYLPFWALWFADQGVSASDIGLLIGIGFATRCITNLVITPRLHKVEHIMPAKAMGDVKAMAGDLVLISDCVNSRFARGVLQF